jgi:hypothetical protein
MNLISRYRWDYSFLYKNLQLKALMALRCMISKSCNSSLQLQSIWYFHMPLAGQVKDKATDQQHLQFGVCDFSYWSWHSFFFLRTQKLLHVHTWWWYPVTKLAVSLCFFHKCDELNDTELTRETPGVLNCTSCHIVAIYDILNLFFKVRFYVKICLVSYTLK